MPRDALDAADRAWSEQPTPRRPFVDTRVRSEPAPKFAGAPPSIFDGDCSRWVGREPPEVPFTIAGLVPDGMVTLLVGHGGAGKSMVAQTAMTAIASASDVFGRATVPGTAAGLFAEDPDGVLHARQERINRHLGIDMGQLSGRAFPRSYAGVDACLWRAGKTTAFFDRLEAEARRIPDLRLLVIDNVALVYADNENDRIAVSGFVNALNGLAARLGCAIILCTHTSKTTEDAGNRLASGSTAWVNAARAVLVLKPDDANPDKVTLRVAKANHVRRGDAIELVWDDGVLRPADAQPSGVFGRIHRQQAETAFLEALRMLSGAGKRVNSSPNTAQYAPRIIMQTDRGAGFTERDMQRAMMALFQKGVVREEECGPPSKRRSFLVEVPDRGAEEGQKQ